jgi:hypothetical protein
MHCLTFAARCREQHAGMRALPEFPRQRPFEKRPVHVSPPQVPWQAQISRSLAARLWKGARAQRIRSAGWERGVGWLEFEGENHAAEASASASLRRQLHRCWEQLSRRGEPSRRLDAQAGWNAPLWRRCEFLVPWDGSGGEACALDGSRLAASSHRHSKTLARGGGASAAVHNHSTDDVTRATKAAVPARTPQRLRRQAMDITRWLGDLSGLRSCSRVTNHKPHGDSSYSAPLTPGNHFTSVKLFPFAPSSKVPSVVLSR